MKASTVRLPNRSPSNRLITFSRQGVFLSVSIGQLRKADAPLIPEVCIYLLGVQCLISLSGGLPGTLSLSNNIFLVQKPHTESTGACACTGPTRPHHATRNRASLSWATNCMCDAYAGWPALLADAALPHHNHEHLRLKPYHDGKGTL